MPDSRSHDFWMRVIYVVSIVIVAAVAFLILGPRPAGLEGQLDVSGLPLVNASLNGVTFVLLIAGFVAIKGRRIETHRRIMLAAFGTCTAFLVSYVIYHWFKAGPKPYEGSMTEVYYFVLLTHIVLAMAIIPMALTTLYRGWIDDRPAHMKIARITLPIWLYVSASGVTIYVMLYL